MQTLVKTYKSDDDYRKDAAKMAKDGWEVANVVQEQRNIGCARGCLLGLFSLVFKPRPVWVVTYQRQ